MANQQSTDLMQPCYLGVSCIAQPETRWLSKFQQGWYAIKPRNQTKLGTLEKFCIRIKLAFHIPPELIWSPTITF